MNAIYSRSGNVIVRCLDVRRLRDSKSKGAPGIDNQSMKIAQRFCKHARLKGTHDPKKFCGAIKSLFSQECMCDYVFERELPKRKEYGGDFFWALQCAALRRKRNLLIAAKIENGMRRSAGLEPIEVPKSRLCGVISAIAKTERVKIKGEGQERLQ